MENFEIITIENDVPTLTADIEKMIATLDAEEKRIKAQKDMYRCELLEAMEKYNIKSIATDTVSVTYKDAYDKETLDTKRLREEHPDIYDEYIKFTTYKPSITVKVKE